ncbi:MAG: DUF1294 domain-containing protein [Eubacterium sp.]|jgi:uncharacterized membrane protein YsdA (DUF1294 family)|uniref:DUF1294 domain-containing protein n=1 Tax=Eubacterium cellulosolvens TaxID=29322 RepID=UPI0004816233|nr:DUF1294 domain-containing protein [[Eubacterium] cellulosolvens]MCR4654522.1 DUF1294 domain-containing protein [Eubacterium sp.]
MKVWVVWISYLGVLSLLALILYGVDKAKAKANAWRISEKTLLGAGFFGGSVGALLGMKLFRHKTKHWYFWAVNLLGLIWQVGVLLYTFKIV